MEFSTTIEIAPVIRYEAVELFAMKMFAPAISNTQNNILVKDLHECCGILAASESKLSI